MRKFERSTVLGLALLLVCTSPSLGSSIVVSDACVNPGDTAVLVTISLSNTTSYAGSELALQYNSTVLDLNRIETGPRLSTQSGTGYYEFSAGKVSTIFFDFSGESLPPDSGVIFNLYFDISPDTSGVQTEISISEVTAVSGDLEYDTVTVNNGSISITTPGYELNLRPGWQWVSTNIDPDPSEMESVFVDCWDDLDIIIACDGSFCIPGVGCWIPGWNVLEMYKVHMADTCTIQVRGSKVLTDTPISLPGGWNCIAYFPECPLEPETALVSIWDNLDIVKNDAGEFCIPGVGCWIECMEPSEGYKLHLCSADTLIYPTNCPPCPPAFAKKGSYPGFAKTTHFNYLENTGESYSIVVNSVELNGELPEVGDEIGVFTPSELCVGGGVWQGDILGISAWQDDDRTEVADGFQVSEEILFKLWDKSNNREIELESQFKRGKGEFGEDLYTVVSLKGSSPTLPKTFSLSQNCPNPFNPTCIIKYALPVDCHVKITIYNILGQKVKTLVDDYEKAGHKRVEWDSKNDQGEEVASGIYFYKIKAGEFTQSKKMVIVK